MDNYLYSFEVGHINHKGNYDIFVPFKEYGHKGKAFIEGKKGSKFALKFNNHTYNRILIIPSIDGISIINGKKATNNSPGYIIESKGKYIMQGWRESYDNIAEFIFKKKSKSLAEKSGIGDLNCGVIGCMVYSEKYYSTYTFPSWSTNTFINGNELLNDYINQQKKFTSWPCDTTGNPQFGNQLYTDKTINTFYSSCCTDELTGGKIETLYTPKKNYNNFTSEKNANSKNFEFDLGASWGKTVEDSVTGGYFSRGEISKIFNIYYASKEELIKIGIDINKKEKVYLPKAFADENFCKIPK